MFGRIRRLCAGYEERANKDMMINDAVGKPTLYTTQMLSNGKWLNHSDYPLGMYKYVDGVCLHCFIPKTCAKLKYLE